MADAKARGRASGRRQTSLVNDSRANDVSLGHLGRISYIPNDGHVNEHDNDAPDTQGRLESNRETGQSPSLIQVSLFEQWYPSTQSRAPPSAAVTSLRKSRPQRAWLLKNAPEAFYGALDFALLLKDDSKEEPPSSERDNAPPALPLLSHGTIIDTTDPLRLTETPALAMATGSSGHILRIVKLQQEQWKWSEDDDTSLRLSSANSADEGHWCGSNVPITQVKFAMWRGMYESLRWLLVQRTTSTTIFEPELQALPVNCGDRHCGFQATGLSFISPRPILTLTSEQTGGNPHCDVAFNPPAAGKPSQLAIIDTCGDWTVWDVVGHTATRSKKLKPVLKACGSFATGPLDTITPTISSEREIHRVIWLPPGSRTLAGRDVPQSPSGSSVSSSYSPSPPGSTATRRRANTLALCSKTMLKTINLGSPDFEREVNLTRRNNRGAQLDAILDVVSHPTDPSQVFVLTSSRLFWLELSSPPSTAPDELYDADDEEVGSKSRPTVVLSCPHLRGSDRMTLRLSVSLDHEPRFCLVSVYSTENMSVSLFCLGSPEAGGQAIMSQGSAMWQPSAKPNSSFHGPQSLVLIPEPFIKRPRSSSPRDGSRGLGDDFESRDLSFCQAIALGEDLGLHAALFVYSLQPLSSPISRPFIRISDVQTPAIRRKSILQHFGASFVVSDEFQENLDLELPLPQRTLELRPKVKGPRSTLRDVDMSPVVNFIFDKIAHAVERIEKPNERTSPFAPLMSIREAVEEDEGRQPLDTLLDLAGEDFSVDPQGHEIYAELERLLVMSGGRQQIDPTISRRPAMDVHDWDKFLSDIWFTTLPEAMLDDDASERFRSHLSLMATELIFAQTGVSVIPWSLAVRQASGASTPGDSQSQLQLHSDPGYLSSSPFKSDPDLYPASQPSASTSMDVDLSPESLKEDPAITRLRKYAPAINQLPPRSAKAELRLLSHWELGADPDTYVWEHNEPKSEAEEEELRQAKRRENARKKRAQRAAAAAAGIKSEGPSGSSLPTIHASSSQPPGPPRIKTSSRIPIGGSQRSPGFGILGSSSQLTGGGPSQTMSQPFAGAFGARPKKRKGQFGKPKKPAGGFR